MTMAETQLVISTPADAAFQFGTQLLRVVEKLIDGQSPEQKVKLWQNWIDFWQPIVDLMVGKPHA